MNNPDLSPSSIAEDRETNIQEYFIKFNGFKIGMKNRQPIPIQELREASSARQALTQLGTIYDIQEVIDIKKL